jgi:hypothetical protein
MAKRKKPPPNSPKSCGGGAFYCYLGDIIVSEINACGLPIAVSYDTNTCCTDGFWTPYGSTPSVTCGGGPIVFNQNGSFPCTIESGGTDPGWFVTNFQGNSFKAVVPESTSGSVTLLNYSY